MIAVDHSSEANQLYPITEVLKTEIVLVSQSHSATVEYYSRKAKRFSSLF